MEIRQAREKRRGEGRGEQREDMRDIEARQG
jgi:hypothetical protein